MSFYAENKAGTSAAVSNYEITMYCFLCNSETVTPETMWNATGTFVQSKTNETIQIPVYNYFNYTNANMTEDCLMQAWPAVKNQKSGKWEYNADFLNQVITYDVDTNIFSAEVPSTMNQRKGDYWDTKLCGQTLELTLFGFNPSRAMPYDPYNAYLHPNLTQGVQGDFTFEWHFKHECTGAIIGIVAACIVGLALIILLACLGYKWWEKRMADTPTSSRNASPDNSDDSDGPNDTRESINRRD